MTSYDLTVHYIDGTYKDTVASSLSDNLSEAISKVMYYEDESNVFAVTCTGSEKYEYSDH